MKKIILTLLILQFSIIIGNAQWVKLNCGSPSNGIKSLASCGNNIIAGSFYDGAYISQDDGYSWIHTDFPYFVIVLSIISDGNYVFAGKQNGIYRSTNNGLNWSQNLHIHDDIQCLVINGNTIIAGENQFHIYNSTNNGLSWNTYSLYDQDVLSLATDGYNIFAGTDGHIFKSTNNGINWSTTSMNDHWFVSLLVSGNYIFAGTSEGLYRSTDNGNNWTHTSLNLQSVQSLASIGPNIFAGGGYLEGVYCSTNNGITWTQINQGFSNSSPIYALLISNNYIYAGTGDQSVWRRPLSELVGIENMNINIPNNYSLSQNYPNPFNPITKIKFDIPANSIGQTFLSVYDILGKEVAKLVNEKLSAGTYEIEWNASEFPSGIYFYRLQAGIFIDTKRMILIK